MDHKYEADGNMFSKVQVAAPEKLDLEPVTELKLETEPFDNYEYDSCLMTNEELKKAIFENFANSYPFFPIEIPWNNYETLIGLIVSAEDLKRTDSYGVGISEMTIEHIAELLRRQIVNLVR